MSTHVSPKQERQRWVQGDDKNQWHIACPWQTRVAEQSEHCASFTEEQIEANQYIEGPSYDWHSVHANRNVVRGLYATSAGLRADLRTVVIAGLPTPPSGNGSDARKNNGTYFVDTKRGISTRYVHCTKDDLQHHKGRNTNDESILKCAREFLKGHATTLGKSLWIQSDKADEWHAAYNWQEKLVRNVAPDPRFKGVQVGSDVQFTFPFWNWKAVLAERNVRIGIYQTTFGEPRAIVIAGVAQPTVICENNAYLNEGFYIVDYTRGTSTKFIYCIKRDREKHGGRSQNDKKLLDVK
jgi:hypothetical protein